MRPGFDTPPCSLGRTLTQSLGIAAIGLWASACSSGDVPKAQNQELRCIDTPQALASLDAPTPLGISAQQVLDFSVGKRQDPLHWRALALGGELTFATSPESGVTQLSTELRWANTPARWVVSVPEFPTGTDLDISDCPDRLEIDVQLSVESQNGALREAVNTTLVATSPYAARIRHISSKTQPPQGSMGLIQTNPEGVQLTNLIYNLSYTPAAHYGELRGLALLGKALAQLELATWPAKAPTPKPRLVHNCLKRDEQFYLPIEESLLGFTATGVSSRIQSGNPVLVSPLAGPNTPGEVKFSPTQDRICVSSVHEIAQPNLRTQFGVSGLLQVSYGDRITRIPAVAVSTTNGEAITNVTIKSNWSPERPMAGALKGDAFRALYGDFGLDLNSHPFYAIYTEARYKAPPAGSTDKPLQGGIQVVGVTPRPRSPSGAIVELLGRWEFRG